MPSKFSRKALLLTVSVISVIYFIEYISVIGDYESTVVDKNEYTRRTVVDKKKYTKVSLVKSINVSLIVDMKGHSSNPKKTSRYLPSEEYLPLSRELESVISSSCRPDALGIIDRKCNESVCKYCNAFPQHSTPDKSDIDAETALYIRNHVLFTVITGSYDNFTRMDLLQCTWLQHVPSNNLYVITDNANKAEVTDQNGYTRHGIYVEGELPKGVTLNERDKVGGYSLDWSKAQYRFFQGLSIMSERATGKKVTFGKENTVTPEHDDNGTARTEELNRGEIHWIVLVDDDTFINLNGLVAFFKRHDEGNQPIYSSDLGWGGAGHLFNVAAARRIVDRLFSSCVVPYMIGRSLVSDTTLKKCIPRMGIRHHRNKRLSHCQATFIRNKLKSKWFISAHIKRDIVMPLPLALLRIRLLYQVVYRRNITCAYDILMHMGSCAYGHTCKVGTCRLDNDLRSLNDFRALMSLDSRIHGLEDSAMIIRKHFTRNISNKITMGDKATQAATILSHEYSWWDDSSPNLLFNL
eukprot:Tbor_TRINITY_DN3447_c0_g2::TRINITY_DN3447_c0_g2_i1::g.3694::m.3694